MRSSHSSTSGDLPDLLNTSISELQSGLSSGLFTSCDLVNAYTARIGEVNDILHAVIAVNPDALSIARQRDEGRKSSLESATSTLYGIPILIKDNIATKDMDCTAGSLALVGAKSAQDSTVVRKLKEAGAIILGRANLSEWANFRSTDNASGFSGVGGQAICAYHPQGDPSGSSSGSAVAMAVGLAAATIGSETDGSIISPATRNNVCGIKPTIGLVSRFGVIPIADSQDSAGPICGTVEDMAIVLDAIAGPDPKDKATLKAPSRAVSIQVSLDPGQLKSARIGVCRQPTKSLAELYKEDPNTKKKYSEMIFPSQYVEDAFEQAVAAIKGLGTQIVDVQLDWPDEKSTQLREDEQQCLLTEFKVGVEQYLQSLDEVPSGCRTLADLIQFNLDHAEQELPERNSQQDRFEKAVETTGLDDPIYKDARARCIHMSQKEGLDKMILDNNVDALITISDSPGRLATWLSAMSGYPICCVPLGFLPKDETPSKVLPLRRCPNFPFGLILIGPPWTEAKLLSYAAAIEAVTQARPKGIPFGGACPKTNLKDVVGRNN